MTGIVQGVGFRPFVWKLAREMGILGWVNNGVRGVEIEAQADSHVLFDFLRRLRDEAPQNARIDSQDFEWGGDSVSYESFEIVRSDDMGEKTVLVLSDLSTCSECVSEIFDPTNRRYRYPFTNCTHCGPRFSIIKDVPYDRVNTTMKDFPMCPLCKNEYDNPADRRFYAQPNACPTCGPHLKIWNREGVVMFSNDYALQYAVTMIRDGYVVAVKGIGGFHLMCDARDENAVMKLRERKGRTGHKPFALLYPSLEMIQDHCKVSEGERVLLKSVASPIVLLERKETDCINLPCEGVAPQSDTLAVMLPSNPLHHILMSDLGFPLVATSGNISDEPIVTDEKEVIRKLGKIADVFLVHNRGIVRHVDDSITRVVHGKTLVMRRSRGYVPIPLIFHQNKFSCVVAFGADMKNCAAVQIADRIYFTQHVGDMETLASQEALLREIRDILRFRNVVPEVVVCDMHPQYWSSILAKAFAEGHEIPLHFVQHHYAHFYSTLSENDIFEEDALGCVWDGTGYGEDGTTWGGEFFLKKNGEAKRYGHLRTFDLIGGDSAAHNPKFCAIDILYKIYGASIFENDEFASVRALSESEKRLIPQLYESGIKKYPTSSMGRLFDAVASILDICHVNEYEGHAAILLEQTIGNVSTDEHYSLSYIREGEGYSFDWEPLVREIVSDKKQGVSNALISARFHNTLVRLVVCYADMTNETNVVLSGGCFQNKYLLENTLSFFEKNRSHIYVWTGKNLPPNDGGIALGQIVAVNHTQIIP